MQNSYFQYCNLPTFFYAALSFIINTLFILHPRALPLFTLAPLHTPYSTLRHQWPYSRRRKNSTGESTHQIERVRPIIACAAYIITGSTRIYVTSLNTQKGRHFRDGRTTIKAKKGYINKWEAGLASLSALANVRHNGRVFSQYA